MIGEKARLYPGLWAAVAQLHHDRLSAAGNALGYRFGPFELDLGREQLFGPQGLVRLRRQALIVLRLLLQRAPTLVTADQIIDQVWGHQALSASALPQAIRAVRRALGDCANAPQYIETRHRRGYRIQVPVTRIDSKAATALQPPALAIRVGAVADWQQIDGRSSANTDAAARSQLAER